MAFTKKSSMDFQRPFVEVSLGPSVTVRAGAEPRGDVVFLPSDSMGSPGALNSAMLKKLGLPLDLPPPAELSKGHAFQPFSGGTICYIVTVGRLPADRALQAYLLDALGSSELQGAGEIWLPLMGTGSGGLSHDQSFTIILETLRSSGWLNRSGRHATISTPDKIPDDASTALRAAIFTAKAALEDGALPDDGASPDVYQLAKTPAVEGALTLAAEFARHPHSARRLSSTSLFFALAESQSAMAPLPSLKTALPTCSRSPFKNWRAGAMPRPGSSISAPRTTQADHRQTASCRDRPATSQRSSNTHGQPLAAWARVRSASTT